MGIEDQLPPEAMAMVQEPAEAGFFMPEQYIEPEKPRPLAKFIDSDNIAGDLDEEKLDIIGRRCYDGYLVDEKSREPWLKQVNESLKLAKQVVEDKTFPWRGAANIKLPIITDAAIKFAARSYSEIIRDNQVVKGRVVGADPNEQKQQRADRVGDFMSWQLMEQEKEWEPDTDKLLHVLPIVGHMFRKRYYCAPEKRTKSEICLPDKVCINQQASSLESARRVTHIIPDVSMNDVVSNQRGGVWRDVELRPEGENPTVQKDALDEPDYFCFLEQQCWLDLDEDGYEEPYRVTLEKESQKVVRIVAAYNDESIHTNDREEIVRIIPVQCFTDYIFIPALDGTYYGVGFGTLLEPLNKVANSLVNQLADAGSLNNIQGGYLSKEIKVRSGRARFELGEWKRTEATAEQLSRGVYPLPTKEPSPTLFSLLGLIMDLTKDLASVKDVLGGDAPGMNVPATTVMALIEQGMKTFNAIYKRIYRSLKKEFKQLYDLNYEYLDQEEYFNILDRQEAVYQQDFEPGSMDIIPIADPNMSTDMQRLARAEALKGAIGMPGVDPRPIIKQWLEAMRVPEDLVAQILPEQDPNSVPPEVQQMMHEAEMKKAELAHKEQELSLKEYEMSLKEREMEVKAVETLSKAIKNFADAEAAEAGQQLSMYQTLANAMLKEMDITSRAEQKAAQSQAQPSQQAVNPQLP